MRSLIPPHRYRPLFIFYVVSSCDFTMAATTATVVLDSQAKWKTWYAEVQSMAELEGVWMYIDPTLPGAPTLPAATPQPLVSDIKADAVHSIIPRYSHRYMAQTTE